MHLKRKRSLNNLSSPSPTFTSSTCASSPSSVQSFYPPSKPTPTWPSSKPSIDESDSLRTRKRHHQTRPPIASIHASTMQRLYNAQQHQPVQPAQQQQQQQEETQEARTQGAGAGPGQKSTLHAFWRIAAPAPEPGPAPRALIAREQGGAGRCEDCDGSLVDEDAMELDAGEDKGCAECRRMVCDGCAVWGGRGRRCAGCEGGRGW